MTSLNTARMLNPCRRLLVWRCPLCRKMAACRRRNIRRYLSTPWSRTSLNQRDTQSSRRQAAVRPGRLSRTETEQEIGPTGMTITVTSDGDPGRVRIVKLTTDALWLMSHRAGVGGNPLLPQSLAYSSCMNAVNCPLFSSGQRKLLPSE